MYALAGMAAAYEATSQRANTTNFDRSIPGAGLISKGARSTDLGWMVLAGHFVVGGPLGLALGKVTSQPGSPALAGLWTYR